MPCHNIAATLVGLAGPAAMAFCQQWLLWVHCAALQPFVASQVEVGRALICVAKQELLDDKPPSGAACRQATIRKCSRATSKAT